MRRALPALVLACTALLGAGAAAARADLAVLSITAAAQASPQQIAADLKAARASVDAALARRQQKLAVLRQATVARDAAAAEVALLKRQGAAAQALEDALRRALARDEEAAVARSELMAAEADVAKGGAVVLRLYDALIAEQKKTLSALGAKDGARPSAVVIYQALVDSRDAVRRVLLPVLAPAVQPMGQVALEAMQVAARPDDDVETLMEKADLARDLEERYLRRAEAVRRRILELQEEQAVAHDVTGMVRQGSLFDEEDRRLVVVRDDLLPTPDPAGIDLLGSRRTTTAAGPEPAGRGGGGAAPPPAVVSPPSAPSSGGEATDDADADPAPPPAEPGFGAGETVANDEGQRTVDAPSIGSVAPVTTPVFSSTEQGVLLQGRGADAYVAGVISSGSLSVDELRAMEKKLAAEAKKMRAQSKKLREQAQSRGK